MPGVFAERAHPPAVDQFDEVFTEFRRPDVAVLNDDGERGSHGLILPGGYDIAQMFECYGFHSSL
jgi:hypothetical protein